MSSITYFTKVQNQVESWLSDMGFKVRSEVDFEVYRADLYVSELEIVIEIDGPSHKKLKKTGKFVTKDSVGKIDKRDALLLNYCSNGIWHVPVDIDEETFKKEFERLLKEELSCEKGIG